MPAHLPVTVTDIHCVSTRNNLAPYNSSNSHHKHWSVIHGSFQTTHDETPLLLRSRLRHSKLVIPAKQVHECSCIQHKKLLDFNCCNLKVKARFLSGKSLCFPRFLRKKVKQDLLSVVHYSIRLPNSSFQGPSDSLEFVRHDLAGNSPIRRRAQLSSRSNRHSRRRTAKLWRQYLEIRYLFRHLHKIIRLPITDSAKINFGLSCIIASLSLLYSTHKQRCSKVVSVDTWFEEAESHSFLPRTPSCTISTQLPAAH